MRPNFPCRSSIAIAFAFVFTSLACRAIAAVDYTAFDLTPYGCAASNAKGISGNNIVGGASSIGYGALIWDVNTREAKSLSFISGANACGISGNQVVGNNLNNAILWDIPSNTAINLNPIDFDHSRATGTNGTQQVGYGTLSGNSHALLWNGSAESVVDLSPEGYFSAAYGISGTQQVGCKYKTISFLPVGGFLLHDDGHALLWSGTAESAIDLHPEDFDISKALGICGNQQVGYGIVSITDENVLLSKLFMHALLWSGTAESAVDLNPAGFDNSLVNATNGSWQVGFGYGFGTYSKNHALLWNGTPESAVDLHNFLSNEFVSSTATGIDERGYVVGNAIDAEGHSHAMLWVPVPEPSTIVLLGFAAIGLFAWLRRRVG